MGTKLERLVEKWIGAPRLVFWLTLPLFFPLFLLCILVPIGSFFVLVVAHAIKGLFTRSSHVEKMTQDELSEWSNRLVPKYEQLVGQEAPPVVIATEDLRYAKQFAELLSRRLPPRAELDHVAESVLLQHQRMRNWIPNAELVWLALHVRKWSVSAVDLERREKNADERQ